MRIRIAVASVTTLLVMVFLCIDNPRGSVTIRGTDRLDAQLRAVKSASSAAQLKDITVNVTAEPGDILIKTSFLRQKNQPFFAGGWSVDYTLLVPHSARIARLDVDDGNASIEGIQNADVRRAWRYGATQWGAAAKT